MVNIPEQHNLEKMEKFFKYNLKIKSVLYNTIPKETDEYSTRSIIAYSDNLFKAINDVEYYINVILDEFEFPEDDKKYFKKFIRALKFELIKSGCNFDKLENFYKVCFASISEQLVDMVRENCVGYKIFRGVSLSKAKSFNEILHVVHQTIVNNEKNLKSLPKLQEKINNHGSKITLYGNINEASKVIFDNFPLELFCGPTEIVSLYDNRVIMMIRDRGHALSIEIEKENDKYYIKYFIPRICNVDMAKNLKGVRKVTENSKFTTGIFETDINKLPFELIDFISKVPTDYDIPKKSENLHL